MDEIEGEIKNVTSADPICIPTPASHPIHTFAPFLLFFLLPPRRVGLLSKQKAESWLLLRLSLPYERIDGFGKPPSVKPLHCILLHLLSPTSPPLLSFAGLILSASGLLLLILDVKVVLSSKKRKKEKNKKENDNGKKLFYLRDGFCRSCAIVTSLKIHVIFKRHDSYSAHHFCGHWCAEALTLNHWGFLFAKVFSLFTYLMKSVLFRQ